MSSPPANISRFHVTTCNRDGKSEVLTGKLSPLIFRSDASTLKPQVNAIEFVHLKHLALALLKSEASFAHG